MKKGERGSDIEIFDVLLMLLNDEMYFKKLKTTILTFL
jgi:signal transduction protein with GAF and PtsI domain